MNGMEEITDQEAKEIIADPMIDDPVPTNTEQTSTKKKKFQVSVTKPEKIGEGVNTYVQYTVKSKGEDDNVQEVIRRYSDFDWLHDLLRVEFPSTLIPPLPEKAIMNRFSPEFLESRRQGLDRFLARVLNHPALSLSADVKIFIQGSDQEIQLARQRLIPSSQAKKEPEEKKKDFLQLLQVLFPQ